MIRRSGSLQLTGTRGGPRIGRTKENIQKVEKRMRQKKRISARQISMKLGISKTSVSGILKKDL